jgi:TonB family protein
MNARIRTLLIVSLLLGCSGLAHSQNAVLTKPSEQQTVAIKFKEKPTPSYTAEARKAGIEGTVRLKVVFLATGRVGSIVVASVSDEKSFDEFGLTKQAIKAAKKIRFEPARRDGVPINVVKIIEYSFSTY